MPTMNRPVRRVKTPPITAGERCVCAILGGFLALMICLPFAVIFLIATSGESQPRDWTPLLEFIGVVVGGFALYGAIVGEERMMNTYERIVRDRDRALSDHDNSDSSSSWDLSDSGPATE